MKVAITLFVLLLPQLSSAYGDYSWPMLGGNLQRNSRADWQPSTIKNPNMTWAFFALDGGDQFIHSPVYSYSDDTVYTISFGGFVYAVNATSGQMLWQFCVGVPPDFPGDPCTNIQMLDELPYGQPTLLESGDLIILVRDDVNNGGDKMVRVSKADGSVVWTLKLYVNSDDSGANDHFYSLPTILPCNGTFANGSECILLWVTRNVSWTVYTIIDADTGVVQHERWWPGYRAKFVIPPLVVDPEDGNVISQYVDIEEACGEDFEDYYKCIGVGKFETWTGEKVWNQTMQQSWSNGWMAIDKGILHVGSDQLYAYSYNAKDGSIRWKILETTASFDMFYPAVCADGTVVYPDNGQYYQGWTTQVSRNKKDLFWEGCNGPCAHIPTMTADDTFYSMEGNAVYAHSCKTGATLWTKDFGSFDSFTNPVAVGKNCVFANVYQPGNTAALVKIEDENQPTIS